MMNPTDFPSNTEKSAGVYVTNISPYADEKTVTEFFSFCGKITNIIMKKESSGSEALVVFESEAAAKTALLLTNALIADRPIIVVPHEGQFADHLHDNPQGAPTVSLSGDQISNKNHVPSDPPRSNTSIIASIIAAGYTLGTDAVASAKKIDEQNGLTQKLSHAADVVREKAKEIDESLKISSTAEALAAGVATKAREIDQSLGISTTATTIFKSVADPVASGFTNLQQKANETPAWQTTVSKVSEWGTGLQNLWGSTVGAEVEEISKQSRELIDQKRRERGVSVEADLHEQPQQQEHEHEHDPTLIPEGKNTTSKQ